MKRILYFFVLCILPLPLSAEAINDELDLYKSQYQIMIEKTIFFYDIPADLEKKMFKTSIKRSFNASGTVLDGILVTCDHALGLQGVVKNVCESSEMVNNKNLIEKIEVNYHIYTFDGRIFSGRRLIEFIRREKDFSEWHCSGMGINTVKDDKKMEARVVFECEDFDLVFIKIPYYNQPYLAFAQKQLGENEPVSVFAMLTAEFKNYYSEGKVLSRWNPSIVYGQYFGERVKIDAPVISGNSGGAVVNENLELVGIITNKVSGNKGVIIPSEIVEALYGVAMKR